MHVGPYGLTGSHSGEHLVAPYAFLAPSVCAGRPVLEGLCWKACAGRPVLALCKPACKLRTPTSALPAAPAVTHMCKHCTYLQPPAHAQTLHAFDHRLLWELHLTVTVNSCCGSLSDGNSGGDFRTK
eukprot:363337-Chlamydomonas_euryale.AAC.8